MKSRVVVSIGMKSGRLVCYSQWMASRLDDKKFKDLMSLQTRITDGFVDADESLGNYMIKLPNGMYLRQVEIESLHVQWYHWWIL